MPYGSFSIILLNCFFNVFVYLLGGLLIYASPPQITGWILWNCCFYESKIYVHLLWFNLNVTLDSLMWTTDFSLWSYIHLANHGIHQGTPFLEEEREVALHPRLQFPHLYNGKIELESLLPTVQNVSPQHTALSSEDASQALALLPWIRYGWWPRCPQEVLLSISLPLTPPTLALPVSVPSKSTQGWVRRPSPGPASAGGRQLHSPAPIPSSQKEEEEAAAWQD